MNETRPIPAADPELKRRLGLEAQKAPKKPSRRLWYAGAAAAAVVVILLALFLGRDSAPQYVTAKAERGDLTVTVSATGTLQPRDRVDIGAEISGRIETVFVDFNDRVTKDQVLAQLDTEQLEAKLAQSRAALAAARANVVQQRTTLEQERLQAARAEELYRRNAIARQDLEAAQADQARAAAALQRSNADAELAAAQVVADQTALSKTAIRSPIDGIVLSRQVEPGQSVAASLQVATLFTLASDLTQLELQVDIDEADIGSVHEGQLATFTVDAHPQQRFNATLVALHNAPKTTEGVVTYQGILLVDNSSGLLRPGLTATAEILVEEMKNVLLVPNGALRYSPEADIAADAPPLPEAPGGETAGRVWVLENGRPAPRTVRPGRSDGSFTAILSGGLKEGEDVITDTRSEAAG
jgi:HlyD family secretion protein